MDKTALPVVLVQRFDLRITPMPAKAPTSHRFGSVEVRPTERRILVEGKPATLGGRAFDLLQALIERHDRTVSKDELLKLVWPGAVVEEANIEVQMSALRKVVGQGTIVTVTGRGYRFCAKLEQPSQQNSHPAAESTARLEIGANADFDLALPRKPSIAVMPFVNLSEDPGQDYFADGMTEDVITALSRFHSLFVVSRNSSFSFKGKPTDVRLVAGSLGVRYIAEGSVRRRGTRLRVTAQLVDASTGNHIWADHYDRDTEDVFQVQEELTRSVVTAIAPEIEATEKLRAKRALPSNLSAYEHAMRAWIDTWTGYRNADTALFEAAVERATRALEIDASSTLALNTISIAKGQQVTFRSVPDLEACWGECMQFAERAIEWDPRDSLGYTVRAVALMHQPGQDGQSIRYDDALRNLMYAHELNPNDTFALRNLGSCRTFVGDPTAGVAHLNEALKLNPRDPASVNVLAWLSLSHFALGEYASGLQRALQAVSEAPKLGNVHMFLAMNRVGSGDIEGARAALATARSLVPGMVDARLQGYSLFRDRAVRARQHVFLQVAAGLKNPAAAAPLR